MKLIKKKQHHNDHELELFEKLADEVPEGVSFVNKDKVITFWNKSAESITGFNRFEVQTLPCSSAMAPFQNGKKCETCNLDCPVAATMTDGTTREISTNLITKEGKTIGAKLRCLAVKDEQGLISGVIEVFTKNSVPDQVKDEIDKLRHEVITDTLTDLGNRRLALDVLAKHKKGPASGNQSFGVIFFDIDNFKRINDGYGHNVGDQVLVTISYLAGQMLGGNSVLCRWGGEEFVALVSDTNLEQLRAQAERLRSAVEASSLSIGERIVRYTISVGVALQGDQEDGEATLERADSLMYKSKNLGKNIVSS